MLNKDITAIIADLLRQATPELESRVSCQTEELQDRKCTEPITGQWIDAFDIKYLLSALELRDEDFAEFFPTIADVTKTQRTQLAELINSHIEECTRCSLKRGYDWELDGRIKTVCLDNSSTLLQLLKNDQQVTKQDLIAGKKKQLSAGS